MARQWLPENALGDFCSSWRLPALILVGIAWGRLITYMVYSFGWPMDGDLAFLYYIAWLMNEHDYVPYSDVHETSFFGTFIFYSLITRLVGYSTIAFHWIDTLFFLMLGLITLRLMRRQGVLCGLLAVALFGEFYYKMGVGVHLQRDYVALLPAALALMILLEEKISLASKAFSVGLLFGIASCIKPQFAGGMLVVSPFLLLQANRELRLCLRVAVFAIAGFLLAWGLGFAWLAAHGITGPFLAMVFDYLPAYTSINGRNFARETADAWMGALKWLGGMLSVWGPPLLASLYLLWRSPHSESAAFRRSVMLFIACWVVYLAYVPMAGKYWGYHILPSYYFLSLLLALLLPGLLLAGATHRFIKLLVASVWLLFYVSLVADESIQDRNAQASESARESNVLVAQLAGYLKENLKPGETTQAHVTHTRGAVFPALLEAKALPATPYLENYLLYHDVDSAFVRSAREKFLSGLQQHPPRFIIYTRTLFAFRGPGTELMFMPFEEWMNENYELVYAPKTDSPAAFQQIEVYEYRGSVAAAQ